MYRVLHLGPILCFGALLIIFLFGHPRAMRGRLAKSLLWSSLIVLAAGQILGQQVTLSLTSATAKPGSSSVLTISTSTSGGVQPAVLEWTMEYPEGVTGVEVDPGPALANSGKTITCSYGISSATCLAWGPNTAVIEDGAVATVAFHVSAASRSDIAVATTVGSAADIAGNLLPVTSVGGMIAVNPPPAISCSTSDGPRLLNQYYAAQCTAAGGAGPYTWLLSSGTLPPGIMLTSQGDSALIAGTPTVAGVYGYTISAIDSNSPVAGSATLAYSVTIQSDAPQFNLIGSMAHLVANQDWTTTFTLVNTSAGYAQTQLDLLGDGGNQLPLPLTLPQHGVAESPVTTPSVGWTLASNASLIVQTDSTTNVPLHSGSARLSATGGVGGFAIFRLNPNAQEAVVPLETRSASSYLLAFDNTNSAALGAAVANISPYVTNVTVLVRDDAGVQIGSGSLPIAGRGHSAFVLSDLFPAAAGLRGTVEFDTPAAGQISVVGVRSTPPGTLTTIPALANVGNRGGALAHIAVANGWKTSFVLVNTGFNAAQAHLNFFDDNGNPLVLPLSFPQSGDGASTTGSFVDQTINAGATLVVESSGPDADSIQTGSAQLTTAGKISGFAILRYEPTGQEAVVPLESRNASTYILAFDNSSGIATALAVSTNSSQAFNVPVLIRDDSGAPIGTGSISLAANGHSAFVLSSQFPVTDDKRGTLEFAAPAGGQISVLGIRTPPTNTFTTLPVIAR